MYSTGLTQIVHYHFDQSEQSLAPQAKHY
uniref:Uncharacterized protein n=1 Tax=Anguilla anguilla TaxID=7936 RepID=A0A0E9V561_ANGAN